MLAGLKPHCKGHQMTLKHTAGTSAEGKAMQKTELVDFLLGTATSHLPVPCLDASPSSVVSLFSVRGVAGREKICWVFC